jgi:dihydrofolate reductase
MQVAMSRPFEMVLGRTTYEIMAAHWPNATEPPAELLNNATKHVASTTLTRLEWENSRLIEGDVASGIQRLKEEDGPELQVPGSANLIQTLLKGELVDEFRLMVFPLVLGDGKRLFDSGTRPQGFQLTSSETSSSGVVILTYRAGAEIKRGSFVA